MTKFTVVMLCVLMGFSTMAQGDTVTLRADNKDIELQVTGVTGEYISARISKKDLKSLSMQFSNARNYPDLIFLNIADKAVECKIKEIAEDRVLLQIPVSAISSLQMFFPSGGKQTKAVTGKTEDGAKTEDAVEQREKPEQMEERGHESKNLEDIRGKNATTDEIRTSIAEKTEEGKYYRLRTKKTKMESSGTGDDLAKTETEGMPSTESAESEKKQVTKGEVAGPKQGTVNESIDREETKAVEKEKKTEKSIIQDPNLGRVEGKILQSGKPLSGCQVKLQVLEKVGLLTKGYRPVEGALEIETVTDENGIYHFMNVSRGLYKLYWKPPSETTWVRRFKMEPDVIVDPGRLTTPRDIETLKRTLN